VPAEITPRRFPPRRDDGAGQKLAYVYFEEEPGRRSAAKLLTKDEARRIAAKYRRSLRSSHGGLNRWVACGSNGQVQTRPHESARVVKQSPPGNHRDGHHSRASLDLPSRAPPLSGVGR
jgi:hypothetical protein